MQREMSPSQAAFAAKEEGEKGTISRRAFSRLFFLFDGILYLVFEFGIKA